jgi:hypothetical protein
LVSVYCQPAKSNVRRRGSEGHTMDTSDVNNDNNNNNNNNNDGF